MIIFFIGCILMILGYIFMNKIENDIGNYLGLGSFLLGFIIFFTSIVLIVCSHVGVNTEIMKKEIEYESLCDRLEIINSDYEDISKSDVIKDISNWNIYVTETKYWTCNPYTNWFYSKKLADSLKYIEYNK